MAPPTTKFRQFPNDAAAETATDSTVKRLAAITGDSPVSQSGGEEYDFGVIDISGGQADSLVYNLIFDVDNNQSNAEISDFRIWHSNNGFVQGATEFNFADLSNDLDTTSPVNTDSIIPSATPASYSGFPIPLPKSLPGAQNCHAADDAATIDISTLGTTDEAIMWAMYLDVAAAETPGTYLGTTSGFEAQHSLRYTFS